MNRQDFQQLTHLRLEEVKHLLDGGHFSGAYYLCGYVVECALKACIARLTQQYDFPDKKRTLDSYTHDIEVLIRAAGLKDEFEARRKGDRDFAEFWVTLKDWSEQSRYQTYSEPEARGLWVAVTDPSHGFLQWLEKNW